MTRSSGPTRPPTTTRPPPKAPSAASSGASSSAGGAPKVVKSGPIEKGAKLKLLRIAGRERVLLNPDCGFAPGSAAVVSLDEVYGKLKNEVAAAKKLLDQYA